MQGALVPKRSRIGLRALIALVWLGAVSYGMGWLGRAAVQNGWFESIDATFESGHFSPATVTFFEWLAEIASSQGIIIFTLLMLVFLLIRRRFFQSVVFISATLTAVLSQSFLKEWVGRARPEAALMVESGSFPSGQAFLSIAIYGLFAAFVAQPFSTRGRFAIGTATVLLLALISYGRLVVGAHFVSDVVAGNLLGLVWLGTGLWVAKRRSRHTYHLPPDFTQTYRR